MRGVQLIPLWLLAGGTVAVFALLILYGVLSQSPALNDWVLWLGLSPLGVVPLWAFRRALAIRADLAAGMAEALIGQIDRCWTGRDVLTRQTQNYLQVSGRKLIVEAGVVPPMAPGQPVTVDFLPRSGIAIRCERQGLP